MFLHSHPYPPFIPDSATKLIVGTLPPPRFTTGDLKDGDVDFCYGSRDGLLWPILDQIFDLKLTFATTPDAVSERKLFLKERGIGICDIVEAASRDKIDASDLGMKEVVLRDLIKILHRYPKIDTLLFTGGNSKNGPEYFFRKLLRHYSVTLKVVADEVPRIHRCMLPDSSREIVTVSLTAPSGAANRAVGSQLQYKKRKATIPTFTTLDFRREQYKPFF